MTPQNGVDPYASRPLPPEILVLILFFGVLVIGAFTVAITAFVRAGKRDAEARRRRGVQAKDPLDPKLPPED